jgi:flotillin
MGRGRKVYHPSKEGSASAYWYIGLLMRRIIVSLENVKHEINDIVLRDKNVAPFNCDITCWFKITDPQLAAEKLDVDEDGNIMQSIRETLNAQVQGVARDAAMKQEILELMRDRKTFSETLKSVVNGDLDEWGVQLVKLEIIDFTDVPNSSVIKDYEARSQAEISSLTRIKVAEQDQLAQVKEAVAKKTAEQANIDADQVIELRTIEKEQTVGERKEASRLEVAKAAEKANTQEVLAQKTKVLGEAEYTALALKKKAEGEKDATIEEATGKAEAVKLEAEAQAEAKTKTGTAEAEVIRQTGTAEADATEKKAEAQKKFTDVSKDIELAKLAAEVIKVKFTSMAAAVEKANVNVVTPDMKFMGFGAEEGAGIGAMVKALQSVSGIDLPKAVEAGAKALAKPTTTKA